MDAMHSSPEEIRKSVRTYLIVFAALAALTVVTVGVSYLKLSRGPAIALGLLVATTKASLVAAYFMHLISERKVIYWILILTVAFFALLMGLPSFTNFEGEPA